MDKNCLIVGFPSMEYSHMLDQNGWFIMEDHRKSIYQWMKSIYQWMKSIYKWMRSIYQWMKSIYTWMKSIYRWLILGLPLHDSGFFSRRLPAEARSLRRAPRNRSQNPGGRGAETGGKTHWETGKTIGKPWENHRNHHVKWENQL